MGGVDLWRNSYTLEGAGIDRSSASLSGSSGGGGGSRGSGRVTAQSMHDGRIEVRSCTAAAGSGRWALWLRWVLPSENAGVWLPHDPGHAGLVWHARMLPTSAQLRVQHPSTRPHTLAHPPTHPRSAALIPPIHSPTHIRTFTHPSTHPLAAGGGVWQLAPGAAAGGPVPRGTAGPGTRGVHHHLYAATDAGGWWLVAGCHKGVLHVVPGVLGVLGAGRGLHRHLSAANAGNV